MSEIKIARETHSRKEFYQYISKYIELFSLINPPRALDIPFQEGAPAIPKIPLVETEGIKEMAERIRKYTTLPPVGFDEKTGKAEIATDPGSGPDLVVDAIFRNHPTVNVLYPTTLGTMRKVEIKPDLGKEEKMTVIPSPEKDIILANTETLYFQQSFPASQQFNQFIDSCKNYLKAPQIIKDGFGSSRAEHLKYRRNYEAAIMAALDYLGPLWREQFNKRWEYQRVTKNTQSDLIMNYQSLALALQQTFSLSMPNKVKPIIDKLQDQMKKAQDLRDEKKTDESSKILAEICRQIMKDFNKKNFTPEEIVQLESSELRKPPVYQQEFILNLYYKLSQGASIWSTETAGLLLQIDRKIADQIYKRLYPFLKAIIEYDNDDFFDILSRIEHLDEKTLKSEADDPNLKDPNLKAMQYAVLKVLNLALEKPAHNIITRIKKEDVLDKVTGEKIEVVIREEIGGTRRLDLPMKLKKGEEEKEDSTYYTPVVINRELIDKVQRVFNQVTAEIVNDVPDENSLLKKIFFRHAESKKDKRAPLTLSYLKEMKL